MVNVCATKRVGLERFLKPMLKLANAQSLRDRPGCYYSKLKSDSTASNRMQLNVPCSFVRFMRLAVLRTLGAWALVDPKTLTLPQSVSSFRKS